MAKNIILCIDDEVTILNSLKTELKSIFSKNYLIEIAENGVDALELVDELIADNRQISLVISDYLMPQMKDEVLKISWQITRPLKLC
jgi:CheY-like chemotaxis protein